MFKTIKFLSIGILLATILISCAKDEIPKEDITVFRAELKGANAVIPNASKAKGTAILNYNNNTKRFVTTTSYSGLTPKSYHIHMEPIQEIGNILVPFELNSTFTVPLDDNSLKINEKPMDVVPNGKTMITATADNYFLSSPLTLQSGELSEREVKALFEGKLYVEFHTDAFPKGEIRGKLVKQ